jgi:hypothetical protein
MNLFWLGLSIGIALTLAVVFILVCMLLAKELK